MYLPIICTLSGAELQARREGVLRAAAATLLETKPLADGFAYRFPSGSLKQLAELVELESACCRFFTFKLIVEPADGPVWLEVTGPPGAKEFLSTLFA